MKKTKRHERKNEVRVSKAISCEGKEPVPVPFEIEGFRGLKCDVCMEVLEYEEKGTFIEDN